MINEDCKKKLQMIKFKKKNLNFNHQLIWLVNICLLYLVPFLEYPRKSDRLYIIYFLGENRKNAGVVRRIYSLSDNLILHVYI